MNKITVIGTGYVGLVAGTCFADTGHSVICADIDENKISKLQNGVIPIYEPGLEHLVKRNLDLKTLRFTTDIEDAVKSSDVIFIAVGTPQDEDGSADLKYVLSVAASIGKYINGYKVVVDKSTVPVGTGDKVKAEIAKHTDIEFDVVSNPEYLKEGTALDDFLKPDRIVIGADSERAKNLMAEIYKPFVMNNHPVFYMDVKSAEIAKYASNAMLATRISFMNEVANFCDAVGANVNDVRQAMGSDKRIGSAFLYPGIGYGGSCFPKDVKAFIKTAGENNIHFKILNAVEDVNKKQKTILFEKILAHYDLPQNTTNGLSGKVFAVFGLAFKPETDDIREAPAIDMIGRILESGGSVRLTDPEASENMKKIYPEDGERVVYCDNIDLTMRDTDALVILTEWREYRNFDFEKVSRLIKDKVIFDGRNIYDKNLEDKGFCYYCIGANMKN